MSKFGPRIRDVVERVESQPGITAYELVKYMEVKERAAYAAIARAIKGGWIKREHGQLYPKRSG